MLLTWTPQAWEDYLYWQATDKRTVKRINELLRDALRNPFEGLGKPEPLRFDLYERRLFGAAFFFPPPSSFPLPCLASPLPRQRLYDSI